MSLASSRYVADAIFRSVAKRNKVPTPGTAIPPGKTLNSGNSENSGSGADCGELTGLLGYLSPLLSLPYADILRQASRGGDLRDQALSAAFCAMEQPLRAAMHGPNAAQDPAHSSSVSGAKAQPASGSVEGGSGPLFGENLRLPFLRPVPAPGPAAGPSLGTANRDSDLTLLSPPALLRVFQLRSLQAWAALVVSLLYEAARDERRPDHTSLREHVGALEQHRSVYVQHANGNNNKFGPVLGPGPEHARGPVAGQAAAPGLLQLHARDWRTLTDRVFATGPGAMASNRCAVLAHEALQVRKLFFDFIFF
jgi:hypothetical protein